MAYIPEDARWYLADVVLEHTVAGDPRNVVHVNVYLIEADSPERAYEKAIALGQGSERVYRNTDGREVRVTFRGLRDLNVIHDGLEDGAELAYDESVGVPEAQLATWLRPREQLSVFSERRPRHDGPNYMPDSVMKALEEAGLSRTDIGHHEDGRLFRPPRAFGIMMLVCLPLLSAMAIAGVWLPFWNPDGSFGDPVIPAILGGGTFGGFALLSVYGLLAYRRTRLLTSATQVRLITVFRDRTIALADVTRARWRRFPNGGSLVLYTPTRRLALDFADYEGRRDLSAFFRASIPEAAQENYGQFEAAVLAPRRPTVISASVTLRLSVASLLLAIACWGLWDIPLLRMTAGPLVTLFSPSLALAAGIDCVRRPTRTAALACAIAWAAVAFLALALWAHLRPPTA